MKIKMRIDMQMNDRPKLIQVASQSLAQMWFHNVLLTMLQTFSFTIEPIILRGIENMC